MPDIFFNTDELPKKIYRGGNEYLITVQQIDTDFRCKKAGFILSEDWSLRGSSAPDKMGFTCSWIGEVMDDGRTVVFTDVPDYMVSKKNRLAFSKNVCKAFGVERTFLQDRYLVDKLRRKRKERNMLIDPYEIVTCVYTGKQIAKKYAVETIDGYAKNTLMLTKCAYSNRMFHRTEENSIVTDDGIVHISFAYCYKKCPCCDKLISKSETLCKIHLRTHFICNKCGEPHILDDRFNSNYDICKRCAEKHSLNICESCGSIHKMYNKHKVCTECASQSIYSYNTKFPSKNYGKNRMYGVEMEVHVDAYSDDDDEYENKSFAAYDIKEAIGEKIMIKKDSSIDYGFEIVTEPLKLNDAIKVCSDTLNFASDIGCVEHDSCGVHIHVSRAALTNRAISNLIFIFSEWEHEITTFSRRSYDRLYEWAKITKYDKKDLEEGECIIEKQYRKGRYCAINIQPENTIEFRVFSSTTDENVIKAYLLFVDLMCDFALKSKIEEIANSNFMDVFNPVKKDSKYKALVDYMKSLNFKFD